VLDAARGAINGVGPPVAVELDVVVPRVELDEVVLEGWGLGGGGGLAETVRTARFCVEEVDDDGFWTAAWDVFVRLFTRAFAVVARLGDVRARRVELLAVGLLAVATEPACSATAFGAARGKPCTIATAAPTASAPPRAPIIAHDSESRRRGSDGASQRREARGKPSSAAQNATPP
jgi:hypothetical protein